MLYLLVFLVIYFLPSLVASARRHHATLAIDVLNLFLGWTFVGWVLALVWACTPVQRRHSLVRFETYGLSDRLVDWWDRWEGRRPPRRPEPPLLELKRAAPLREVNETELEYEIRLAALRSHGVIE